MRAQWHLARLTREDIAEALRLAAQATALDPGTTLGLNIAAFAHLYAIAYGWEPSAAQAVMAAYQSASKAVALDFAGCRVAHGSGGVRSVHGPSR